jgi:hypothetical protein
MEIHRHTDAQREGAPQILSHTHATTCQTLKGPSVSLSLSLSVNLQAWLAGGLLGNAAVHFCDLAAEALGHQRVRLVQDKEAHLGHIQLAPPDQLCADHPPMCTLMHRRAHQHTRMR